MDMSPGRRLAAVILAIVAVPLTFLSIFDPLEGGMALLATFALNRMIRWISTIPTNRLYLGSFVAAVVVGGVALGMAIAQGEKDGMSDLVRVLAYAYSAVTLFVTAGAAKYAWDILAAYRPGTTN
jgi:hypothetical protein